MPIKERKIFDIDAVAFDCLFQNTREKDREGERAQERWVDKR